MDTKFLITGALLLGGGYVLYTIIQKQKTAYTAGNAGSILKANAVVGTQGVLNALFSGASGAVGSIFSGVASSAANPARLAGAGTSFGQPSSNGVGGQSTGVGPSAPEDTNYLIDYKSNDPNAYDPGSSLDNIETELPDLTASDVEFDNTF